MIPEMNHQVEMGWSVLSIFLGVRVAMIWFTSERHLDHQRGIHPGCHKELPCGDGSPLKSGSLAEHILENTLVVGDISAVGDLLFGSCTYTIFAT